MLPLPPPLFLPDLMWFTSSSLRRPIFSTGCVRCVPSQLVMILIVSYVDGFSSAPSTDLPTVDVSAKPNPEYVSWYKTN
ncbi:hypothetical protein COP2_041130 [Malus domestica]